MTAIRPNRVTHADLTPTQAAIAAYVAYRDDPLFVPPPTVAQVRLVAEYCQDYIFGPMPIFVSEEIADLRRRVVHIKTLVQLADWLWDCRQSARLEPL